MKHATLIMVVTAFLMIGQSATFGGNAGKNNGLAQPNLTGAESSCNMIVTTVSATRDTYVSEHEPGESYGEQDVIALNTRNGNTRLGLVRFDLSQIPEEARILAVTVNFTAGGGKKSSFDVCDVKVPWNETSTWLSHNDVAGSTYYGSTSVTRTRVGTPLAAVLLNADGIEKVQEWVNTPTSNMGFSLQAALHKNNRHSIQLCSSENATTGYRPTMTVVYTSGNPIANVDLPAGVSLYGYTGETQINAKEAFQALIDSNKLALVRWIDPATSTRKELYHTNFPAPAWVNEIGYLKLGQGYIVKTTSACTLSIMGNKDTSLVTHNLPSGGSIIGFNQETPLDALTAFQPLIDAEKLELVRWIDPSTGVLKELYYTTFPSPAWVNEIGKLTEGQGYLIMLNAPHKGFKLPGVSSPEK